MKRCCRRRVCAAKRSAQHVPPVAARGTATASSHARAGIVQVRGRPDPSPRRRAPSTSWERKKSAFFCFGTPVAGCIQGYSHSGELAWHVLAHDMNLMAKRGRGGVRVGVNRKGFGAGPRNPKRSDPDVLPDHRLQGQRAHRGLKDMWRVVQVLICPPSRSAQSARSIARFA